jgi:hypothetical protein
MGISSENGPNVSVESVVGDRRRLVDDDFLGRFGAAARRSLGFNDLFGRLAGMGSPPKAS